MTQRLPSLLRNRLCTPLAAILVTGCAPLVTACIIATHSSQIGSNFMVLAWNRLFLQMVLMTEFFRRELNDDCPGGWFLPRRRRGIAVFDQLQFLLFVLIKLRHFFF